MTDLGLMMTNITVKLMGGRALRGQHGQARLPRGGEGELALHKGLIWRR